MFGSMQSVRCPLFLGPLVRLPWARGFRSRWCSSSTNADEFKAMSDSEQCEHVWVKLFVSLAHGKGPLFSLARARSNSPTWAPCCCTRRRGIWNGCDGPVSPMTKGRSSARCCTGSRKTLSHSPKPLLVAMRMPKCLPFASRSCNATGSSHQGFLSLASHHDHPPTPSWFWPHVR